MNQPKKQNQPKRSKTKEVADLSILENLAECVTFTLKKNLEKQEDPFEAYAFRLKFRMHRKTKLFKERFAQGYAKLLEQLTQH